MNKNCNPETTGLEIAVIGMAGRFPGAKNIAQFWDNLTKGVEAISYFTTGELTEAGIENRLLTDPKYIKAWGALEDIEYFDASFFGFTPADARIIDPQTRFFLECSWEALEDGGYDPGSYNGFIGIFAGASDNILWKLETRLAMADHPDSFFGGLLNNKDFMSLLTSYKLNLKGPSFTMYTACSSSLTAIHLACQAILNGECDMALAGGVTVIIPNKTGYLYRPGMLNSADGHCRAFDARAKGTIFGSGVGVVALKRLEEATEDRDNIYAVVKGSAINNDGLRKVGFTAPSIAGQQEVICTAQQMAHVAAESIGCVETHGTATELGDPVEIEALKMAFNSDKKQFCALGSVKSNVGHLDSAAGVTGFIKTVLSLKHRLIPASLHFEAANPEIDFENSPFFVNTELREWHNGHYPLRAGVSSFGIGGTNAHVILEEWPEDGLKNKTSTPELILLSAGTAAALKRVTENFIAHLKENPGTNLADAAYTLAVGRKHYKYRKIAVCSSIDEVIETFSAPANAAVHTLIEKDHADFTQTGAARDAAALEGIGRLWLQGHRFDWQEFHTDRSVCRISLPTYPFERQYYWIEQRLLRMIEQGEFPGAAAPDLKPRPNLVNPYVAPANELEQKISGTWQKLFGFEQIGVNDDFYELGGDSVKAITLSSEFDKAGCPVSITEILTYPTIKKLAVLIGERDMSQELEDEIYEQRLLRDLDCLIRLNKGRNEKNMFIVHPDTGIPDPYRELAVLLENKFNVYGIRARGVEPGTKLPESHRQMAAVYVEQILALQESGPYITAGSGVGNMLAYEIGSRLEKLGHRVEKIVLLHPHAFITGRAAGLRQVLRYLPGFLRIVKAPLLVIQAAESSYPAAALKRCARMTRSEAVLVKVPGAHNSMLEKPQVEELAAAIINNL